MRRLCAAVGSERMKSGCSRAASLVILLCHNAGPPGASSWFMSAKRAAAAAHRELSEPPTTCVASARRRRPNLQNCVSHYVFNLLRSPTADPDTVANPLRYPLEATLSVESDGNNGRSSFCRRYIVRSIANLFVYGGSSSLGHLMHVGGATRFSF